MIKSGVDHIASLRDGRAVYLHGQRVEDVTRHPAYANAVKTIGRLFDFPSRHPELMTSSPNWRARQSHLAASRELRGAVRSPQSARGLERPACAASWAARPTTSPRAFPACTWGSMCSRPTIGARAKALADYYRYARDNDLYLTYVIINPQADRSKSASEQTGRVSHGRRGRSRRRRHHGARRQDAGDRRHHGQRGPGHLHPAASAGRREVRRVLRHPDEHQGPEDPVAQIVRRRRRAAFSTIRCPAASTRTTPCCSSTTSRCRGSGCSSIDSLEMCQKQFHATPAHVYQNYQAMVRLSVKFRFLLGIAHRIAEVNGTTGFPQVRETLGRSGGRSRNGRRVRGGHGGQGHAARALLRARSPHALRRADADPEIVRQGAQHAARAGRRRHDHAALVVGRLSPIPRSPR